MPLPTVGPGTAVTGEITFGVSVQFAHCGLEVPAFDRNEPRSVAAAMAHGRAGSRFRLVRDLVPDLD